MARRRLRLQACLHQTQLHWGGSAADATTIDACWLALKPGGRIVVNGVTLETELALLCCVSPARRNADADQYRACRANRRTLRLAAGTAGSAMGLPETGG
jgi:precorrin-6B methylase 2